MAALELSKELYVEYGAAPALAIAGESSKAQTLATDLERRFGQDTGSRFSYLPVLRAVLALSHGENRDGPNNMIFGARFPLWTPLPQRF